MKVLVVGGAGYIGSHVVKELMAAKHRVTVFDNFSSGLKENLFKENDLIEGDILNEDDLQKAFSRGFDGFVHLAAFKGAGESMYEPEKYATNNITGTLNLIKAAVKNRCKIMVFSSSAAIFGEPQYLPIDENHPKNPENYYGFTKLQIEGQMEWFSKLRGLKFASLRYFNAAGYDPEGIVRGLERNPANLLPVIMEVAAGKRDELKVFGNDYDTRDGTCIRDYVHVTDLARAHVLALEFLAEHDENLLLNLGSETGVTVSEMLEAARRITGKEIPSRFVERRAGDPACLVASSRLARDKFGWKPEFSDVDTLVDTTRKAYNI